MRFDAVLVGGGLQGSLAALAILEANPAARIALVERAECLGGNHTWSFHAADLSARMRALVRPLVVAEWPACEVAFPGVHRRLPIAYASISSARLHEVVTRRLAASPGSCVYLCAQAIALERGSVTLGSGEVLGASLVMDSRGPEALPAGACGYQKFLGLELALDKDHGLGAPMLMDARVEQQDGFRFVYLLPLSARSVLIEDTYYSDTPQLDIPRLTERIHRYAATLRLGATRTLRTESGVLPIPLSAERSPEVTGILQGGYAGGWFHPTTGYSLPAAAALAEVVGDTLPDTLGSDAYAALRARHEPQRRFAVALNRLLFRACPAPERWRALERFYRLPLDTIERFSALSTSRLDRARILIGRPPAGTWLGSALRQIVLYARSQ